MAVVGSAKRMAVALSGGVDSTVAALLLKQRGHNLIGVYMRNWDERDETGVCHGEEEWRTVQSVCKRLKIDCVQVNFVREYWNMVFTEMVEKYRRGLTPSPDVDCNRHIKFGALLDHCRQQLGVEKMATGHYAQLRKCEGGEMQLLKAVDSSRDQTYFLSSLNQSMLRSCLFPLGGLLKRDVFVMAREAGFEDIAAQKESRGICYIGKRDFSDFLNQYIKPRPGPIALLNGVVIGTHSGVHTKTRGQRIAFKWKSQYPQPAPRPAYYVCEGDPKTNVLYVVPGRNHASLSTVEFTTHTPHWISGRPPEQLTQGSSVTLMSIPRYQVKETETILSVTPDGTGLHGRYADPQRAVSPGQASIFYDKNVCLGCAEFKQVILPTPFVCEPIEQQPEAGYG